MPVRPSSADEPELVRRAQALDENALSALFNAYYPKILRYGMNHLADVQSSEDLASEVMVRVLNGIQTYRFQGSPFSAWVFRIARNKLIDQVRRDHRVRWVGLSDSIASPHLAPDTTVERALEREEVQAALRRLNDRQAQVIALRFFHGLDTPGVATVIGCSQSSVKSIQHRALKSLRQIMLPEAPGPVGAATAEAA